MSCSPIECPICHQKAHGSDIDYGNRARIYCENCSTYDITRQGKIWLDSLESNRELAQHKLKNIHENKILVIFVGESKFRIENKESKSDRAAPDWLTPR